MLMAVSREATACALSDDGELEVRQSTVVVGGRWCCGKQLRLFGPTPPSVV